MVRNYKRKTEDRWSTEDLIVAVNAIMDKQLLIHDAVSRYGISRATLYRHLRRCSRMPTPTSPSSNNAPRGRIKLFVNKPKTLLNPIEEEALVNCVQTIRKSGTEVKPTDIKKICFEYVVSREIPHKFCMRKRIASDDWYHGFCKRNPDVRIISTSRVNTRASAAKKNRLPGSLKTPGDNLQAEKEETLLETPKDQNPTISLNLKTKETRTTPETESAINPHPLMLLANACANSKKIETDSRPLTP